MKKMVMTVVAMMAVSTMFADEKAENKYEFNINNSRVANYVGASFNQADDMEMVHKNFKKEMKRAEDQKDETKKAKLAKKAILNDLSYMRMVLNEDQLRKYRTVLNATLNNRGIEY